MRFFSKTQIKTQCLQESPAGTDVAVDRRRFLSIAVGLAIAIPLSSYVTGCGDSKDKVTGGDGGDGGPVRTDGTIRYTSSENSGHTHTFELKVAEIESPPGEGVSGSTSSSAGHVHTVMVTAVQLAEINEGKEVVVTTSNVGHTHTFTLFKV